MAYLRRDDERSSEKAAVSRRAFLGAGAALVAGGLGPLRSSPASAASDAIWIEKTIPELLTLMASGALSSLELTRGYIQRIKTFAQ